MIFNEIVDANNSHNLDQVKLTTNWGDFSYAGGVDTNVPYFNGTLPNGQESQTLKVTGITNLGYVKDMSPDSTTIATGLTQDTTASVPATRLHVSGITKGAGSKLAATLDGVDHMPANGRVEYIWSQDALTPTLGWQNTTIGSEMATKQTEGCLVPLCPGGQCRQCGGRLRPGVHRSRRQAGTQPRR